MGMDLHGEGGYFRHSIHSWRHALRLAEGHGWEPAGTEAPEISFGDGMVDEGAARGSCGDWDGGYFTNDYQYVTEEDAANLADALVRALDRVPDKETAGKQAVVGTTEISPCVVTGGVAIGPDVDPVEHIISLLSGRGDTAAGRLTPEDWYGGDKNYLIEFIAFCRTGGFMIG